MLWRARHSGEFRRALPLVLVFAPLAATIAVATIQGVALRRGCWAPHLLTLDVGGQDRCAGEIPLAADLPSLALAGTATASTLLFQLNLRRWARFREVLTTAGTIDDRGATCIAGHQRGRAWEPDWRHNLVRKAIGLAVWIWAGWWFYGEVTAHGHLFEDFDANDGTTAYSAAHYLDHWWANDTHQPVLAWLWILTGAVGAFYAVRLLWLNMRVFKQIRVLADRHLLNVGGLRDPAREGWDLLFRFIDLGILGSLIAAISLWSALYLSRGSTLAAWLIGSLVLYMLVTGVRMSWLNRARLRREYARGLDERIEEARALGGGDDGLSAVTAVELHWLRTTRAQAPSRSAVSYFGIALTALINVTSIVQLLGVAVR